MGRFLLLVVGGFALVLAIDTASSGETRGRQTSSVALANDASMARQAARSGFAIAERHVTESFGTELDETGVTLDGGQLGSYDARVTSSGASAMDLEVTGRYGSASHTFYASYGTALGIPAALIAHADTVDVAGDPDIGIDGAVNRPPSVPSSGWDPSGFSPIGGVATSTAALGQAMRDDWGGRINRISGSPAFLNEGAPAWTQPLVDEAALHPSAIVRTGTRFRLEEARVGRPDAPAIVVANSGARLRDGSRGYGILIVTGDFTMIDDARWEGIIIVRDTPGVVTRVHIEDEAKIFGTLILHGTDESAGPAPYGAFQLRMLDYARINWSVEPIERLVGLLSALDNLERVQRRMASGPSQ